MSASYLSWPGASAEIPDERASLFRPGVLLDGPLHGYAIIQRAEHLSGGRVRLATGTLYTALDRLTAEGLVDLVSEAIVNGRARRSYGLTPSGPAHYGPRPRAWLNRPRTTQAQPHTPTRSPRLHRHSRTRRLTPAYASPAPLRSAPPDAAARPLTHDFRISWS